MSVTVSKFSGGMDVSRCGAFPAGEKITFVVAVERRDGVGVPILRICPDGGADRDYALSFVTTDGITDIYETELDPAALTGADGLLFYCFVFPNGRGASFTDSVNNVDFELRDREGARFSMLIYKRDFSTPAWFHGTLIYHIFVDRFRRGEGQTRLRDDCRLDPDWEGGIPQFGAYAGAPVENNVFFGGNLWGIAEKLGYLKSLGVGVIYLSPVFEARSNHKYDIGDYLKIDDGFGGEEAFEKLVTKARDLGIRIILDGVFNHTGDDSRYFDRYGRYGSGDKYYDWYCRNAQGEPECWWGVKIMPRLNQRNPECRAFFTGEDGVARRYIREGVGGWRLDVADELCDEFLDELRAGVKEESGGEAVIIGEVWENAAVKESYGSRRRYLRGEQLDSVMNYPVRNAIIAFVERADSDTLYNTLTEIYCSYPRPVCDCLMNLLGTHDTERILTVLGGEHDAGLSNAELSVKRMSEPARERAKRLLYIAAVIQYTVYGVPSLYYGDEAGLEGYHDPFCRLPFPWGREDKPLTAFYQRLGSIRAEHSAFAGGEFEIIGHGGGFIEFRRKKGTDVVIVAANRGAERPLALEGVWYDELTGDEYENGRVLPSDTAVILTRR